jgi:hypothetical protein
MTVKNRAADLLALSIPLELESLDRTLTVRRVAVPALRTFLNEGPLATLQRLDEAREAASVDAHLSPAGRRDRVGRAVEEARAQLTAFEDQRIKPLIGELDSLTRALMATRPVTDPTAAILQALRHQEIRASLSGLDPLQRNRLYLETDDSTIREAMESAPPVLTQLSHEALPVWAPFVSPEHVAARRLEAAEHANPAAATELRDATAIKNLLASTVASARSAIDAALETGIEA